MKKFLSNRYGKKESSGRTLSLLTWIQEYGLNLQASVTKVSGLFLPDGKGSAKMAQNSLQVNATGNWLELDTLSRDLKALYGHLNLSLSGEHRSPRDKEGHGTHTLSTAGGNFVRNASLYGLAKGGPPHVRVATCKACWPGLFGYACTTADMLAAFDQGIHDGVDVFSISVAFFPDPDYFEDAIAIGKIVFSARGNFGPEGVANVAPWIITVAASTVDREFPSIATLGNNTTYTGQSRSQFQLPKNSLYSLVSSMNVRAPNTNETAGERCFLGALDPRKVKGKIVACLSGINDKIER